MEAVQTTFDYALIEPETRIVVQQRTSEIKSLMRRAAQDIIDIGEKLTDVKTRLGHGNFGPWLALEFQWSYQTAHNLMNVAESFKSTTVVDLPITQKALYVLAAPSTPESARVEAVQRAEAGEAISYSEARAIVAGHRERLIADAVPMPEPTALGGEGYRGESVELLSIGVDGGSLKQELAVLNTLSETVRRLEALAGQPASLSESDSWMQLQAVRSGVTQIIAAATTIAASYNAVYDAAHTLRRVK